MLNDIELLSQEEYYNVWTANGVVQLGSQGNNSTYTEGNNSSTSQWLFMSISLMDLTLLRFYIYDLFSEFFLYKIEDNEYNQMIEKINKIDDNFREILRQISNVDMLEIRKKFER